MQIRYFAAVAFLLIAMFSLFQTPVAAQKTQANLMKEEHYHRGVELFGKKIYGAAIEEFTEFLKSKSTPTLTTNARLYSLMSQLRLQNQNVEERLEEELQSNPENSLNDLAYFELGNYHF